MAGLTFTLNGKLDPSYKASLNQAVSEAQAASLRIQQSLRAQIVSVDRQIAERDALPTVSGYELKAKRARLEKNFLMTQNAQFVNAARERVAAARAAEEAISANNKNAWMRGQSEWRRIQGAQTAEMLANFEKQRIAAVALKAEQLAAISVVARHGGIGAASGASGHKYGGRGGIISEIAVIGHEMLQGRGFARVLGSISILAQRLGLLGTVVKSTAATEIAAAFAQNELAGSMARTAITAEEKAASELAAAEATGLGAAASEAAASASLAEAAGAREAAVAQTAKAGAAVAAAEMAAATATVSLGPIGWLLIAVVAVVGSIFLLSRALRDYAAELRNVADLTSTVTTRFQDEAAAMKNAADEAREFARWLAKLGEEHNHLVEKSDEAVEAIHRLTAAQGELIDTQLKGKYLDIEIAEKTGLLSRDEAIRRRAALEKQAIQDKSDFEIGAQKKVRDQLNRDVQSALKRQTDDIQSAKAAESKLQSPKEKERSTLLHAAERKLSIAENVVDEMESHLGEMSGGLNPQPLTSYDTQEVTVNGKKYLGSVDEFKSVARNKASEVENLKNGMSPSEIAAASAKSLAEQSGNVADQLVKAFNKANVDFNSKVQSAPAQVKAAQDNVDKAARLEALSRHVKPEVTERERVGLGAPAVAMLDVTKSIDRKLGILVARAQAKTGNGNYGIVGVPPGFGD